jgi:hypothetical protein
MQGSKPVMQKSPVNYGAPSAPHFSWTMAAQATALAAAFLFVTALVCGAILSFIGNVSSMFPSSP